MAAVNASCKVLHRIGLQLTLHLSSLAMPTVTAGGQVPILLVVPALTAAATGSKGPGPECM